MYFARTRTFLVLLSRYLFGKIVSWKIREAVNQLTQDIEPFSVCIQSMQNDITGTKCSRWRVLFHHIIITDRDKSENQEFLKRRRELLVLVNKTNFAEDKFSSHNSFHNVNFTISYELAIFNAYFLCFILNFNDFCVPNINTFSYGTLILVSYHVIVLFSFFLVHWNIPGMPFVCFWVNRDERMNFLKCKRIYVCVRFVCVSERERKRDQN